MTKSTRSYIHDCTRDHVSPTIERDHEAPLQVLRLGRQMEARRARRRFDTGMHTRVVGIGHRVPTDLVP